MSGLRIKAVSNWSQLAELGSLWQALAAQDEQAGIFNDWHWNSLWWEHYGHLGELLVLLVYDDQQLVGVGPFYRGQGKALGLAKLDTLRFIGSGGDTSPDDLNILAPGSMRQPVTDAICDYLLNEPGVGRLLLADIPVDSAFYKTFVAKAKNTRGYLVNPSIQSRLWTTLPAQWSDFRRQISRNTHKQMKRRQNRLDAVGNASITLCSSEQEIDQVFDALVHLHAARRQTKGGGGSFESEQYRAFHRALIKRLHQSKQVWLIALKLDDQIIGVEYAFMHNQTVHFFQSGFDPAHEQLSPGHVLMTFAIKQAIGQGAKRIDLLKGDYDYKSSYADKARKSAMLIYYRRGLFSLLARLNDARLKFKRASNYVGPR